MSKPSKPNYEVGYGKPPEKNQFKPGASGNPKGRPKGSKSLNTMLHNVLHEKVEVTDSRGHRRMMTKVEAVATQMVNRAVKGDHRATKEVLALAPLVEQVQTAGKISSEDARKALLAKLLQMKQRMAETAD